MISLKAIDNLPLHPDKIQKIQEEIRSALEPFVKMKVRIEVVGLKKMTLYSDGTVLKEYYKTSEKSLRACNDMMEEVINSILSSEGVTKNGDKR